MKVLLVDIIDHMLFLQGLQSILQARNINVVGTALNMEEALAKAIAFDPDAIILNLTEDGINNLDTLRRLKRQKPSANVIVFSDNDNNLRLAELSGASEGHLLTKISGEKLIQSLRQMEKRTGGR